MMQITTLEELKVLPSFSYLMSPYSKYAGGLDEAARLVAVAAATLMRRGHRIFCPIAHSHQIGLAGDLDNLDWSFWRTQDDEFMKAANGAIVLRLPGWDVSVGVTDEIATFDRMGKPIIFVHPVEVGL